MDDRLEGAGVQRHTTARQPSQTPSFRACSACRDAHAACDPERPCRRCARLGRGAQCVDAPLRKRGRGVTDVEQPNVYVRPKPSVHHQQDQEDWASVSLPFSSPQDGLFGGGPPRPAFSPGTSSVAAQPPDHHRIQQQQMQHFNPWSQYEGAGEQPRDGLTHWRSSGGITMRSHHNPIEIKEEDDGEQQKSTGKKRRKQKKATSKAATTTTTSSTVESEQRRHVDLEEMVARLEIRLEQVTSVLGNEVRLLSDSNARLLDKVKQLEMQLTTVGSSPQSCESSSGTPSSPSASAFSFELSVLHSGIVPALALEARQQLPWLCHYQLPGRFAVPSFSYPIAAFSKLSSLEVPPVCSYANEAFVSLTMTPWHELIGQPYSALFTVYNDNDRRYTSALYNQRPMSASEVFSFSALLRCGDGRTLRLCDQSQFFFDFRGQAQHVVICVLNSFDDGTREGEAFDRWVPLPYVHDPQKAAENRV